MVRVIRVLAWSLGQCGQDDQPRRYAFRKFMVLTIKLSRKVEMSHL